MAEHWQLHWITSIYKCWSLQILLSPSDALLHCFDSEKLIFFNTHFAQSKFNKIIATFWVHVRNLVRSWETVIESQRVNISIQYEGHKSTLTCPETKLKEYTTRLKNWLDTDKGNKKLQRPVEGMGGIGLRNLHGLAWQEGSRSTAEGNT